MSLIKLLLKEEVKLDTVLELFKAKLPKELHNNNAIKQSFFKVYKELMELLNGRTDVTAYRVINVNEEADIDMQKIGNHYTTDKYNIDDVDFLESIGIIWERNYDSDEESDSDYDYSYKKFFMVTVNSHIDNIDWVTTIDHRIVYDMENEINFIDTSKLKILKVEDITDDIKSALW